MHILYCTVCASLSLSYSLSLSLSFSFIDVFQFFSPELPDVHDAERMNIWQLLPIWQCREWETRFERKWYSGKRGMKEKACTPFTVLPRVWVAWSKLITERDFRNVNSFFFFFYRLSFRWQDFGLIHLYQECSHTAYQVVSEQEDTITRYFNRNICTLAQPKFSILQPFSLGEPQIPVLGWQEWNLKWSPAVVANLHQSLIKCTLRCFFCSPHLLKVVICVTLSILTIVLYPLSSSTCSTATHWMGFVFLQLFFGVCSSGCWIWKSQTCLKYSVQLIWYQLHWDHFPPYSYVCCEY